MQSIGALCHQVLGQLCHECTDNQEVHYSPLRGLLHPECWSQTYTNAVLTPQRARNTRRGQMRYRPGVYLAHAVTGHHQT